MTERHQAFLRRSVLTLILGATPAAAQNIGTIRGTVVDEAAAPISGAKVTARALDGRPTIGLIRYVETDRQGHFAIDRLEWGNYGVFAMKEESAYPDIGASLYSNDVFPRVTLATSAPTADIRIQLGPKAGTITGSVTNAVNGAPLNSSFKLMRSSAPDKWLSTSVPPTYRVLIPPSTDVLLEVTAPGFETWRPTHPLHLVPGAEMLLDIALEPSHDPNLHPSKFLVPDSFVGWLLLEYQVKNAPPTPEEGDVKIFRFAANGVLNTSSDGPARGAEDQYFYYSADGSLREIPADYRNGRGMIWGQHEGTRNGELSQFGFFVGTEEQYKKYQSQAKRPGPLAQP